MFCLIAHSRMMDISNTICAYIHAVFKIIIIIIYLCSFLFGVNPLDDDLCFFHQIIHFSHCLGRLRTYK